MDWFDNLITDKLNAELERDSLEQKSAILAAKASSQKIEIGKLKLILLTNQTTIKRLEQENKFIKENYVERKELNSIISQLIDFLYNERKLSDSEEKRHIFEKFIEVLKKLNV